MTSIEANPSANGESSKKVHELSIDHLQDSSRLLSPLVWKGLISTVSLLEKTGLTRIVGNQKASLYNLLEVLWKTTLQTPRLWWRTYSWTADSNKKSSDIWKSETTIQTLYSNSHSVGSNQAVHVETKNKCEGEDKGCVRHLRVSAVCDSVVQLSQRFARKGKFAGSNQRDSKPLGHLRRALPATGEVDERKSQCD